MEQEERAFFIVQPYDIMAHRLFDYDQVAAHLSKRLRAFCPQAETILDVACGSGNLSLPLARLGYRVTGLDVSPDMVAAARCKAAVASLNLYFICQDMRQPYSGEPVDAAVCFYGGIHFLPDDRAVGEAFQAIYAALKPGGLWLFDQFRSEAAQREFAGVKAADFGSFYIVTHSTYSPLGGITHRITWFIRQADGLYRREQETQRMRVHPWPRLVELLTDCGFVLLSQEPLSPHLSGAAAQVLSLFVAQKPA